MAKSLATPLKFRKWLMGKDYIGNDLKFRRSPLKLFLKNEIWPESGHISFLRSEDSIVLILFTHFLKDESNDILRKLVKRLMNG